MLPIIRTFISLPAGVARMPFWRFTRAHRRSAASRGSSCSRFIGKQVGDNWENWKDKLHYVDYAVAALIVLGVVYLLVPLAPRRGAAAAGEPAADAPR